MACINKQKYMYSSPDLQNICIEDTDKIQNRLTSLIQNNMVLHIKGHGSRVNNINWSLFFGIDCSQINKTNVHTFNRFNYTVCEWFRTQLPSIKSNKIIIQYDGDKILQEDYTEGDNLLQNYTGILFGLVFYLKSLNKEVHILNILDKDHDKWDKHIQYRWENGLNQLCSLGVHVHFWIYDLLSIPDHKDYIANLNIVNVYNNKTEIWGYKGYYNLNYLHTLNYKESMILNFGVGSVPIDEYAYLKQLNPILCNKMKDKIKFYKLSRSINTEQLHINFKTLDHIIYLTNYLSS